MLQKNKTQMNNIENKGIDSIKPSTLSYAVKSGHFTQDAIDSAQRSSE